MPSRTTWRILIPTFAVSGLLLAVGVGGGWYVHRVNREVSDSLDENLAAAQSAGPFRQISFDVSACKLRTAADGNEQPKDARGVKLRIADDGPGLSPEVLERLFEPFVSTKDTGIGLGLSICQRIVESHDGRIMARNRHGGGAEFTIYLPRSVSASLHGDSRAQGSSFNGPVTEENS